MPRPRARGCGSRPTRRCRIPTGKQASPTTQAAARRTAWSSISAAPASGTTSPVPLRGDTPARLP
eukprot:scaffold85238_cov33-Phaeocystis_antarctica.AAC.1